MEIAMKFALFALFFVFAFGGVIAQAPVWQPSAGHTQIEIWPGAVPNAQSAAEPEYMKKFDDMTGGVFAVGNVSRPTMTVYSPQGKNTSAAVVVFPGGGYQILAIDLEGTEVCDWLTSKGITCVLLKYRVPNSGPHWHERCKCQITPKSPTALQDAQRTIVLVRLHAAEWHIDPHKIGVLGFSAGGDLVASISTTYQLRLYPAVDAADKESCRPDFAVALYPGHLSRAPNPLELHSHVHVTRQTPPTFIIQAEDDPVDSVNNSLVYYAALKKAGVATELHLYAQGGHGFGLRPTKFPITAWPQLVETWLRTIGMVTE
jgi:acetyl esterase/lipase